MSRDEILVLNVRLVAAIASADHAVMMKKKPSPSASKTTARVPSNEQLHTALRVVMMPRDGNQYGSIFGGVILSYIDQAGFIEARRHGVHRWVTVSLDKVEFHAPVQIGDVVSFLTRTERTGTSSVQVRVRVEAERYTTGDIVHVTEAHMTMVSVNAACRPIPFNSPPTVAL